MDLSYFEEGYEVLVSEAVYDEEGTLVTPKVTNPMTRIKARPRTKTLADVDRVIEKHNGKNSAVIDKFVGLYLQLVQWDWLDSYLSYEEELASVELWNEEFAGTVYGTTSVSSVIDEEGEEVSPAYEEDLIHSAKALPVEPTRPAEQTVEDFRASYSKDTKLNRDAAVKAITVEVDGMVFDGDEISQGRMARAVVASDSDTEETLWILADNTPATVTALQLKTALKLAGQSQTTIWVS